MDARDSLAEGLVLTPGRDPYASARGESPATATANGRANDVPPPRSTPMRPSMARNIFGGPPRGTPRRPDLQNDRPDDEIHVANDADDVDEMDAETANDGGGPWLRVRAPKRQTKDRSPQGTPRRWNQGKPNLGPTPLKIRELPPFPHRARNGQQCG